MSHTGPISNTGPFSKEAILAPLNEQQRCAVTTIEGPLLVLAGPGSGKTRVVTHRIAYMIDQGVSPRDIVALTFTNKAADEMRTRLLELAPDQPVWMGTFHRFCSRLLRTYAGLVGLSENFTIYDTDDSRKLLKEAVQAADIDLRHYTPDAIFEQIGKLKHVGITSEQFRPNPGSQMHRILEQVYPRYQQMLRWANAVDFNDLLLLVVQMLIENPELRRSLDRRYAYMLVDEYQDTNTVQYKLIRLLNQEIQNLAVTGDPDQSIYGWRGANIRNILDFEKDYKNCQVVRLEQNYRSTKSILTVADQLIMNNHHRKHKTLRTDNPPGAPVRFVEHLQPTDEARQIAAAIATEVADGRRQPQDFAILYRTNFLSRALEHALREAGIPYQIVQGLEFYQRREIKDLLAYLHLLNNESNSLALERIINVPPRAIGTTTMKKLKRYALECGVSLLAAARQAGVVPGLNKATSVKVSQFVATFDKIAESRHQAVGDILAAVLRETSYRDWLVEGKGGGEEGHERASNVDELLNAAVEFDMQHPDDGGLEAFLEQTALVSDTDAWESTSNYVTLLTIHAAKGLEFPVVFIIGLEDGLLPHERSQNDPMQLEEERRLLFVGITRAQQELCLSRCYKRGHQGYEKLAIASRFLMELPRHVMDMGTLDGHIDWDAIDDA
ncbi:MAG TPA: UvrD-helicase domain-containing protein, partial [Pirellulaceae bacterium]|nr:UvrD-helicase domain-containing protein [Pirellulaceae bacterium]